MANHCFNGISFYGKNLTKIKKLIREAIEVNINHGWLPDFIDANKLRYAHYLFDVEIISESKESIGINCWTKWSPPIEELELLCRQLKVNCTCSYEESGMGIYGQSEYNFETDTTTDVYLDDDDTNRVQYDEENDCYLWDGKIVDSDIVAYQEMLDDKLTTNLN